MAMESGRNEIIDSHVHLSKLDREDARFADIRDALLESMRQIGTAYSFVLADSEPDTPVSDLETTLALVRDHPKIPMLGSISPFAEDRVAILARLDGLATTREIIGVKLYPGFEEFYPDDERCHAIYELCVRHDMPVLFHSGESMGEPWREAYNHPIEIANTAMRFPALKIIIAHFSYPHFAEAREAIIGHPNIYGDISGLAHPEVVERCGKETIRETLESVMSVAPEKVLFGTDWPICSVADHLELVASLRISDEKKSWLLGGNARRLFGLKEDA